MDRTTKEKKETRRHQKRRKSRKLGGTKTALKDQKGT